MLIIHVAELCVVDKENLASLWLLGTLHQLINTLQTHISWPHLDQIT